MNLVVDRVTVSLHSRRNRFKDMVTVWVNIYLKLCRPVPRTCIVSQD